MENKKALVLASGGLDSTTILYWLKKQNYEIYAISYNYGQRNKVELKFLEKTIKKLNIKKHIVANIDLKIFGGSALTSDIDIPEHELEEIGKEIPLTYVPARNTIFLSYALGFAEVNLINELYIGVNALDFSGYPDCRPEYIAAYENMANLALVKTVYGEEKIKIQAPLLNKNKKEIIEMGLKAGADYADTVSCYNPIMLINEILFCAKCDACKLRLKGFSELGVKDPARYVQ